MVILLFFAFISGLLTILAPCIWPLLPIIISASTKTGNRRSFGISLGICLSFALFTLTIAYIIKQVNFDVNSLRFIAVMVVSFMGLTLIVPKLSAFLESYVSKITNLINPLKNADDSGFVGGLITGVSLGLIWSPCAGPILASIASLSATMAVDFQVVLLTFVYTLGVGIPLFLFSFYGQRLFTKFKPLSKNLGRIQQVLGVVMLMTALSIYFNYDKIVSVYLLNKFPTFTNFIYKLEGNDKVIMELNKLRGINQEEGIVNSNIVFTDPNTQTPVLPKLGTTPEISGISSWINSEPLTFEALKGKVVLVDFWTYTCINCIRTLPYLKSWDEKYRDKGLVIVGVHTPEFEFEKDLSNVTKAVSDFGIKYPVAQDNNYETWSNFKNIYWPAKYLIDKEGIVRYYHFGEGSYEETEKAIMQLLGESGQVTPEEDTQITSYRRTPEIYLGSIREMNLTSDQDLYVGDYAYFHKGNLSKDAYSFLGKWNVGAESAKTSADSTLFLNFDGKKVYLVIKPTSNNDSIFVYLDGKLVDTSNAGKDIENGKVKLDGQKLYELINLKDGDGGNLRIEFRNNGIEIFAFTFG